MASSTLPMRLRSNYICSSCRHRSFSSSAARASIIPESPRYIDIPEPPQQTRPDRPSKKGTLPVPRDVARRTSKESIASATRDPLTPASPPSDPRLAFKAAQAALRKHNLSTGYEALSHRRNRTTEKNRARSNLNRVNREALLAAPERDTDRLTSITLDPSVQAELSRISQGSTTPDPDRQKRLQSVQARLSANERKKREARQDALHTLYMNARTFIVDEEGLNKAIDEAFGTEERGKEWKGGKPSLWGTGAPPKMQDLVAAQGGAGRDQTEGGAGLASQIVLKDRIRRMGEVVTGGRMDP
ncbi:hypothetical protein B9Z65_8404 [Elsinoe australis]|uniref:Uncharacterized protein n=1 Tax=Elsinoe australis TaxID=40998 RepID=A0A2P7YDN8_9PEZI|nr:hypothetical protein B9Z65_8404 [Elsinoe australis]